MAETGKEGVRYVRRGGVNVLVPDRKDKGVEGKLSQPFLIVASVVGISTILYLLGNLVKDSSGTSFGPEPFVGSGTGNVLQTAQVSAQEIEEQLITIPKEIETAYPGLSDSEKVRALAAQTEIKEIMDRNLGPQQIGRLSLYEGLIGQSVEGTKIPADLLLGLVAAESLGDPLAVSGAGAKGLTQMMDEMAIKHKLKISDGPDDERFIPEKILPATAAELDEAVDRFGDLSLALWSWHIGSPQVYGAVRVYGREVFGDKLPDINVAVLDDSREAKDSAYREGLARRALYKLYIQQKNINFFRLFENEAVKQMFAGPEWDKTKEYMPRIIVSMMIYNQAHTEGDRIN